MLAQPSFALRKEGQLPLVDGRLESAPETMNNTSILPKYGGRLSLTCCFIVLMEEPG